jgi:predicted oxidoreductase
MAHPRDTAAAIKHLVSRGLVRHVGVSNYYPEQLRALKAYLDDIPIVSNQVQLSLTHLEYFYEGFIATGVLDQCEALSMTPLAWSPLGGGVLSGRRPIDEKDAQHAIKKALVTELETMGKAHNATPSSVALAWLMAHPSGIIPLVGSNNPDHVRESMGALDVSLTREEWYRLFTTGWGRPVP